jgi:nitrate reductase assembly molybdenum cofactor insertion protein NarJ
MLAIMADADDIQHVAAALEPPGADYLARLDEARQAIASQSIDASRQLEMFIERVRDLTSEELGELYDETFRGETPEVRRTLSRLGRGSSESGDAGSDLTTLEPLLARFEAERNPFAYVVRSLCCLLLRRVVSTQMERT